MVTSSDVVSENDGAIEICAVLSSTSVVRELECNLSAIFVLSNGTKGGVLYI